MNLPVYFGDAGSQAVLHSLGAHRAACAVITLDTPGANYRSVWALHKHYPHVKTYVRAHDVDHGLNLEKVRPSLLKITLLCILCTAQWPHPLPTMRTSQLPER